jgi:hypothetical protein
MKSTLLLAILLAGSASAVTINLYTGQFRDSSGVPVPDGTLFALVANSDSGTTLPGGMGLNSTLTNSQANSVFTTGQTIASSSSIGGDTVFFIGAVNGATNDTIPGLINTVVNFNLTAATSGLAYGLYFFPGATLNGGGAIVVGGQVGGLSSSLAEAGQDAMIIPGSNAANVNQGALDEANAGTLGASRFTAVNLIPEPSAAILGAIGALGLLRRRRI